MSYNVYPVTKTEEICDDYIVKINGEVVQVNTARVSSYPFNRRWPGHQRDKSQSELINFVSLETDESLHFEIISKKPFENVIIRPQSLKIKPETDGNTIKFTLDKPSYFTVEPFGRSNALHVFADPVSDYGIDTADKNVIYFGKGTHEAGVITLASNQTLFIDEGAVVYGCVKADDAENIKILGRGILDNNHNTEQILFEANEENNETAVNNAKRTHTIQINYCKNIEIDGITIRDSLVYNIRPIACEDLSIKNVKIIGCWRYNSDGIDMHNCRRVLIDNCFIRTFDDSICVKGFDPYGDDEGMARNGQVYDTFKDVTVKNCVIWNDWGKALEIGAETQAEEICDINFNDCDIIHVTGSVLDCANVDYADVHSVTYENIRVEYDDIIPQPTIQSRDDDKYLVTSPDYAPPIINVAVFYHFEYSAPGNRRGRNHNFYFKDIFLYGRQQAKILIEGHDETYNSSDITIENLYQNGKKLSCDDVDVQADEYCKNIKVI